MELVSTLSTAAGLRVYAVVVRRSDGYHWNTETEAFEAYNASHWLKYAILSDGRISNAAFPGGTFYYRATYPSAIYRTLTSEKWFQTNGDATPRVTDFSYYLGQSQGGIISTPGRIEASDQGYSTLYAVLIHPDGTVWNDSTSAFEAFNAAHWAQYAITLATSGPRQQAAAYPAEIPTSVLTTDLIFWAMSDTPDLEADIMVTSGGQANGSYPPYHSQGEVDTSRTAQDLPESSKLRIWQAVLATLRAAQAPGQPLEFVPANSIFDGIYPKLDDMPQQAYPAIVLELDEDDERFFTTGTPPAVKSDFKIFVSCLVREARPNKGISGDPDLDTPLVGLLAFVDAVKNVLQGDQTLGNTLGLQKISFPKAPFFFEQYPIRECKISATLENQLTTQTH